jgi:hypothetical protein
MVDHLHTAGEVVLDAGAVQKLAKEGKSLLPIGVVAVRANSGAARWSPASARTACRWRAGCRTTPALKCGASCASRRARSKRSSASCSSSTWACAPRRCSGRAGSASGGRRLQEFLLGTNFSSFCSTTSTFLPGAILVRFETRKMWVSTAIVGSPKAVFSTTLAVLRPTPGRASSASRARGTSPPYWFTRISQVAMTFLALVLYRPMVGYRSSARPGRGRGWPAACSPPGTACAWPC